jgi:hypothetical protein
MTTTTTTNDQSPSQGASNPMVLVLAWAAVGAPLLWGVLQTLRKALALFA